MQPRRIIAALLASLVSTAPAAADRRRRVAQPEEAPERDDKETEATQQLGVKIDDLIEVAIKQSPDLARSRQERNAARGQAAASRREQQWVVTAQANLQRFSVANDPEINAELRPFDTVSENKLTSSLGIGRNLPTGGNISLDFNVARTLTELAIPVAFQADPMANPGSELIDGISDEVTVHQAQARITLKQPLGRGFGSNVALAQQKKGDLAAAESTIRTQLAAEELVRDIVVGYWELAYSDWEVQTRADSVAAARRQEENSRKEFRAGTGAEQAIDAIQFEIATREEALLDARGQYEKKSLDLRRKVGLELSRREIVIRPLEKFEAADDEFDADSVIETAKQGNRRVAALILAKRQAEIDVRVAKNAMLPQVDVTLSGGLYGQGKTVDTAFSRATDGGNYIVSAGLQVSFDIGGAAKGAHDAAIARRARVEVDQLDVQRQVDTEITHAVNQVKSARARVSFAENAVRLGENNIRAEAGNIQAGKSTMFQLMQRQTDLFNARLRLGRAIADYHIAVAQVQFFGGLLLKQYGVDVRPGSSSRRSAN